MKYNKYKYLVAALYAANATMSMAQEEVAAVAADTIKQDKVQIAFREVDAEDVLVGVSKLDYTNILEKNYFTYTLSDLTAFIPGGASTWGGSYLVLVDGVPRDINNIKPDEIASVTFMKGANAVAIYGSHASKGVILINTKRGEEGDIRIKARVNTGFHVAKAYPKYLGSAEYMTLYNEALKNDGKDPLYSAEDIYHYASGENPYRYPSVDFYSSEYLKKAYNRTDVTAEIDGGSEKAHYYTNISYYRLGTMLNVGEAKKGYADRFNVRGNVDIAITDFIKSRIDANISFYNSRGYVANSGASFWTAAATWRPNRIAPLIPIEYLDKNAKDALSKVDASSNIIDGKFLAGSVTDKANVFADLYCAGSSKYSSRQLQFETGLDIDLSQITDGLSFHTQFAIDYATSYNTSYTNNYMTFEPIWTNYNGRDVITGFSNTYNKDAHSGVQNLSGSDSDQTYSFDARFNYDRTFGDHSLGGIAVVRGFQYRRTGEYHSESDASIGFNVHYDFAKNYFVDATASIVHTAKLAEGHRNAFSPSITLGWNLAKESFLEGGIFDNLTLSASASNLANDTNSDVNGYNLYLGTYSETGAWWAWSDQSMQSTVSKQGYNEELELIRNKEIAVGLKGSLLNKMFTFDVSAYRNLKTGIIIEATNIMPEYMKSYYPESSFIHYINHNEDLNMGVQFALGYNKKFGEVEFNATVTGLVTTNEAKKRDDTQAEYDYQKRQGKYLDGRWGLECQGFFNDVNEIATSPDQTPLGQANIKPGDLKYKDQNGDGKIDSKDYVELGRYGNPFEYGIGLTAKYRNFTLFVAGNGYCGGLSSKNSSYIYPTGSAKYSVEARNCWTEKTSDTATLPRLTATEGQNNKAESNFWTYKMNAFDLGKVQLTYDLPSSIFDGMKVLKAAQVYVSGDDLLHLSKEQEYEDTNVGGQPYTRFYNLGLKVTF